MATQSLQYIIKAQLEDASIKGLTRQLKGSVNDGVIKQLENQLSVVQKAIKRSKNIGDIKGFKDTEFKIQRKLSEANAPSAGTAMKSMGSGFADMFKPMNIMTGLVGEIAGGVAVIAILAEALQPAIDMAKKVLKLAGELLRPIGDLLTTLIRPLFGLLMPIVRIMNVMMMPFRQAANLLASSAMMDLAKGMTSGDGGLIAKGIAKSLLGGMAIFGGFMTAIEKIGLMLIKALITGLYQLGVAIVYKPMFTLAAMIVSVFSDEKANRIMAMGGTMSAGIEATLNNVFGLLDGYIEIKAQVLLQDIKMAAGALGTDLSTVIPQTLDSIDAAGPVKTFISKQAIIIDESLKQISLIMSGAMDKEFKGKTFGAIWDTAASTLTTKIDGMVKAAVDNSVLYKSQVPEKNKVIPGGVSQSKDATTKYIENYKNKGMDNASIINAFMKTGNFQSMVNDRIGGVNSTKPQINKAFDPAYNASLPKIQGAENFAKDFTLEPLKGKISDAFDPKVNSSLPSITLKGYNLMGSNINDVFGIKGTAVTTMTQGVTKVNNDTKSWYDFVSKSSQMYKDSFSQLMGIFHEYVNMKAKIAALEKTKR